MREELSELVNDIEECEHCGCVLILQVQEEGKYAREELVCPECVLCDRCNEPLEDEEIGVGTCFNCAVDHAK